MRILIDAVAFENPFQVGVQRYFREVLRRVGTTEQVTLRLGARPRAALPDGCRIIPATAVDGRGFDLFQTTRFTSSPDARLPQVLVIHDMVPELHWRYDTPEMAAEVAAKRAAGAAATRIICISHATAADVRRVHPGWADKIRVVYSGADHLSPGAAGNRAPAPPSRRPWRNWLWARRARRDSADLSGHPYVLFVGDRGGYKNFDLVAAAMTDPAWDAGLFLAVVGSPLGHSERAALSDRGVTPRVKWLGRVSDRRLQELYAGATCFVFPSKAEGLGFPLLEAQLARTPVVCSDTPVFREVAGPDGAFFFDPADPAALARSVRSVCDQPPTIAWRDRARANVDRFQWDRCAAQTLDVYREAVLAAGVGGDAARAAHVGSTDV